MGEKKKSNANTTALIGAAFIMWFFTFYKLYFLRDRPQLL